MDSQGNVVPTTKQSNDKIAFQTQAGETYTISKNGTSEVTYPVKIEATEHGTVSVSQEAYREGEEVYLTGLELLMVMLAGVSLPRPEYNKMMKDLIAALKANGPRVKPKVRLLYTGGHADNPEFFDLLQQNDAHVVSDNTGFGTRAADVLIREDGEPLEAIIDYYFEEKPVATRQMGTQVERMERLLDLVKQYKADGVVASRLYMCDLWAFEHFLMRKRLHENNVPFLELEVDYTPEGQGQIKTRVQAFVESLADRQTA